MDVLLQDRAFMEKLNSVTPAQAETYRKAEPFPHTFIDDFFPPEVLSKVLDVFPQPGQVSWQKFDNDNEKKLAFSKAEMLPTTLREFLYFMNSYPVLRYVEQLTGIPALLPDPTFAGGGAHQIQPGGKLGVHVDFNKLEPYGLERRVNLLVYMNKDWREEYGGHFELWDRAGKGCVTKILPLFNRIAVFSTTEDSYHGHPTPLTCPPDRTRKSIALYYYTVGRPESEQGAAHSTIFVNGSPPPVSSRLRKIVHGLTPPVVADAARYCRKIISGK